MTAAQQKKWLMKALPVAFTSLRMISLSGPKRIEPLGPYRSERFNNVFPLSKQWTESTKALR
jgi:hypothetical protein